MPCDIHFLLTGWRDIFGYGFMSVTSHDVAHSEECPVLEMLGPGQCSDSSSVAGCQFLSQLRGAVSTAQ